jgi:hypothetical protein
MFLKILSLATPNTMPAGTITNLVYNGTILHLDFSHVLVELRTAGVNPIPQALLPSTTACTTYNGEA